MKKDFHKQLEEARGSDFMSPEYRKRKLIMWAIRTMIAIIMYYFLWDVQWVRWTLWLYVPLNLFLPFSLLGGNYFLNKKIERVSKKINDLEEEE